MAGFVRLASACGSLCRLYPLLHPEQINAQVDFGAWYSSELRLILQSTDLPGGPIGVVLDWLGVGKHHQTAPPTAPLPNVHARC